MNSFDIAVYLVLAVAVIAGFRAGLVRSGVTILGYLLAMPIAVWATSLIVPQIAGNPAVSMVLIFYQLIPPTLQPAFLVGSQLRPMLSAAGQKGFKSLPPEATAMIDQFKRDHRI